MPFIIQKFMLFFWRKPKDIKDVLWNIFLGFVYLLAGLVKILSLGFVSTNLIGKYTARYILRDKKRKKK